MTSEDTTHDFEFSMDNLSSQISLPGSINRTVRFSSKQGIEETTESQTPCRSRQTKKDKGSRDTGA